MHPVLFHIGALLIPSYGAVSALGVVLALFLAQRTARMARLNPAHVWNLSIIALFAALVAQRLLLVAANWNDLRRHPSWLLALAMIQHPLLALVGSCAGVGSAIAYARWLRMPLLPIADVLTPPLALALAFEQTGALLAGAGFGTPSSLRWAVTYTNPLAARWSGTPLFIPLHPVQAYAALAFLTLSIFLVIYLPARRQSGDIAGLWFMLSGLILFFTELWRDREGRGSLLHGALDGPQVAAILFVLASGFLLRERHAPAIGNEIAHG